MYSSLSAPNALNWYVLHLAVVRYLSVEYFKAEIAPTHWLTIWNDSLSQGSKWLSSLTMVSAQPVTRVVEHRAARTAKARMDMSVVIN
jgi:hypothetical protein